MFFLIRKINQDFLKNGVDKVAFFNYVYEIDEFLEKNDFFLSKTRDNTEKVAKNQKSSQKVDSLLNISERARK